MSSLDAKFSSNYGSAIDLNSCHPGSFRSYAGMYPTLAKKIANNKPYKKVDDVLNLDLTPKEREVFMQHMQNFFVPGGGNELSP